MKKIEIPWVAADVEAVMGREVKERSSTMKALAWCMCIFLLAGGILTPYKITIIFAVLYMLVLVMDKKTAVTSRGVEIFYDMKVTTSYQFWPWKEIGAISREENKKYPGIIAVYFTKGDRTKRLFFKQEEWNQLIRLAKQGNHGLEVVKN